MRICKIYSPSCLFRPSMRICKIYSPSCLFGQTHTYTNSGDGNTCENSYAHVTLGRRRCALPPQPPPRFFSKAKHAHLHIYSPSCLFGHTHIPIQSQVIAVHVRIAMFMLLCQACPFAHLLSFMSFWSHTHTYTKSGDSNTCENSDVHAALSGRRCALPPTPPPVFFFLRPNMRICKIYSPSCLFRPSMRICKIYSPSCLFVQTHTYTNSRDSNTCENSYVHAALGGRRCALPPDPHPSRFFF